LFFQCQTLTADEVYGLTAYILSLNGVNHDTEVMDELSLPKIKMPAQGYRKNKWLQEEKSKAYP